MLDIHGKRVATVVIASLLGAMATTADAQQSAKAWPDTRAVRIEALAILETLNAQLLSNDSATLTLDRWCEAHKMAVPAKIVAERVHGADKAATEEIRKLLNVSSTEAVRFRHVRLHCGDHVLSEADNWYVPARLTPEMNQVLDTTDTAFGRAVQALNFRRWTLSAKLLWSPLPPDWEMGAPLPEQRAATLTIPHEVLEHRAVLRLRDARRSARWSRSIPARCSP